MSATERSAEEAIVDPPDRCLSLEIRGPWAHFRRVEGNIVKQTYKTIPRTTVAGLLAAVLGIGRDEYYDIFAQEESAVAIEPTRRLRTMKMPMNTLSTAAEDIRTVPRGRQKVKIGLPDPSKPRQQHNYEVLVEPGYRIDVWVADQRTYSELRSVLEAGESHYVPSLGLSEHLASVDFRGEHEVTPQPTETTAVDSVVPGFVDAIIPEAGTRYELERWPAYMTTAGTGRTTTGFTSVAFNPEANPLRVDEVPTADVDGRRVMFT